MSLGLNNWEVRKIEGFKNWNSTSCSRASQNVGEKILGGQVSLIERYFAKLSFFLEALFTELCHCHGNRSDIFKIFIQNLLIA